MIPAVGPVCGARKISVRPREPEPRQRGRHPFDHRIRATANVDPLARGGTSGGLVGLSVRSFRRLGPFEAEQIGDGARVTVIACTERPGDIGTADRPLPAHGGGALAVSGCFLKVKRATRPISRA